MTTEFKIGDRVRRVKPSYRTVPELFGEVGKEYTVSGFSPNKNLILKEIPACWVGAHDASCFELVTNPIEEAKKLLEKEGYTVTLPPSKEPLKGQIAVLQDNGNEPFFRRFPLANIYTQDHYKLLAVIPWEEGQGLPDDEI